MKQEPKILYDSFTGDFYFVPSYKKINEHYYRANIKICITKRLREIGLIQ